LRDGRRVVLQVASVDGVREGDPIVTELFAFRPRLGPRGSFVCGGTLPALARVLSDRGEDLPAGLFAPGADREPELAPTVACGG
jgi:hypothetical protein